MEAGTWLRLNGYVDDSTVFSNSQELLDVCYKIINDRFPCKRLQGITLIIGINVEKTADSVAFDQRQLIDDVANYTGQTDAPNEFSAFPSGWEGFTSDDCALTRPLARS